VELTPDQIRRWHTLATHPEVERFFVGARQRIAEVVRRERPICLASGACCNFEKFGHRMYVSGLEAAFVVARIDAARRARAANPLRVLDVEAARGRGDCPYLVVKSGDPFGSAFCGEHEERPLGCRIFYCDRGADGRGDEWQSDLYEAMHREVLALHEVVDAPYRYLEWREALAAVARAAIDAPRA
jgi:hypothetical protein